MSVLLVPAMKGVECVIYKSKYKSAIHGKLLQRRMKLFFAFFVRLTTALQKILEHKQNKSTETLICVVTYRTKVSMMTAYLATQHLAYPNLLDVSNRLKRG